MASALAHPPVAQDQGGAVKAASVVREDAAAPWGGSAWLAKPRRRPATWWRRRTGRPQAVASALAHPPFGQDQGGAVKAAGVVREDAALAKDVTAAAEGLFAGFPSALPTPPLRHHREDTVRAAGGVREDAAEATAVRTSAEGTTAGMPSALGPLHSSNNDGGAAEVLGGAGKAPAVANAAAAAADGAAAGGAVCAGLIPLAPTRSRRRGDAQRDRAGCSGSRGRGDGRGRNGRGRNGRGLCRRRWPAPPFANAG